MRRSVLSMFSGAAALAVTTLALAQDHPPAEARFVPYTGVLPACGDPSVLSDIGDDFARRESGYWASPLTIVRFLDIDETGYRSNGASYIPRRYCAARALFNDGRRRRVVYDIAEHTGFIGFSPGVTWCVVGLDRNHAFSPGCHAAGP